MEAMCQNIIDTSFGVVGMVLAQMVVDSIVLEGRSISGTAQRYGVSNSWVHELVRR